MKNLMLTALLALGGCAMTITPGTVMEKAPRFERMAKLPPAESAICVSRNAESISQYFALRGPLDSKGGVEVLVNWATGITSAVIHLEPRNTGSAVTAWVYFYKLSWEPEDRELFLVELLKGC